MEREAKERLLRAMLELSSRKEAARGETAIRIGSGAHGIDADGAIAEQFFGDTQLDYDSLFEAGAHVLAPLLHALEKMKAIDTDKFIASSQENAGGIHAILGLWIDGVLTGIEYEKLHRSED